MHIVSGKSVQVTRKRGLIITRSGIWVPAFAGTTAEARKRSIPGCAMAERGAGLALLARVDVEVDHADAARFEHRYALCDRRLHVGRAGDRPDADRALRLGELG